MMPFGHDEGGTAGCEEDQAAEYHRRQPAGEVDLGDGQHQGGHRGRDQQRPAGVKPLRACWSARVSQQPRGHRDGRDSDRDVHQEHRAPAGELHQDAAENLASHETDRGGRAVHAERPVAQVALGEAGGDQRQGRRRDQGGARALQDAGGDEQDRVVREAAGQRGRGEDQQADDEHPAAAQQVGGSPAEHQQAAERDRVAGDDPLHGGGGEPELALDRRQGHVHDAEIQHDHERGHQNERQPEDLSPVLLHDLPLSLR